MNAGSVSNALFWGAFGLYLASAVAFFAAFRRPRLATPATAIAFAGLIAQAASIAARTVAVRRVPWGNMFEYSMVVVFLLVGVYLIFVHRKAAALAAAPMVMVVATITMGLSQSFYVKPQELQVALESPWLKIHVISAITATSIFSLAFVFAVLYLIKERAERRAIPMFGGSTVGAAYVGLGSNAGVLEGAAGESSVGTLEGFPVGHEEIDFVDDVAGSGGGDAGFGGSPTGGGFAAHLPKSAKLDAWSYRLTTIAFPIWTWAVIAGAIWAGKAWGRYWGWDPKEAWAFITWVVYAGYLHARATSGWRGRRAAWVNVTGFVALWICYYAVNLWIAGLHSYAKG